jgi:signal transduction histidine kinase
VVLRLASSETNLLDERKTSELRKEFIAVLGDEVRHPLTAIISAADMLKLTPLHDRRRGLSPATPMSERCIEAVPSSPDAVRTHRRAEDSAAAVD